MCGRYVLKREDLEALLKEFGVSSLAAFHSRYNIAPTSIVPLIRRTKPGAPELAGVRWGLIPSWSKADAPVRPLVNVRAETLTTRLRDALRSRRCVLPASGFYEWQTTGAKKQPWYFAPRRGGPFGLAAIWDSWRGNDGTELETCAVITTAPNRVLDLIHDRMPVMLTPAQSRVWIEAESGDPSIERLLTPAPDEAITALKVGAAVGKVRNDGPECIAPAPDDPPEELEPQLSLGF